MIIKNLTNFIKNNKVIFVLLIITQIVAVMVILFSYGIYRNNRYKLKEAMEDEYDYALVFNWDGDSPVEFSRVREELLEIVAKYDELIENVLVRGYGKIEELDVKEEVYKYENGYLGLASSFEYTEDGLIQGERYETLLRTNEGRYFTEEELNNGAKICVIGELAHRFHVDKWIIEGEEYEVVGHESYSKEVYGSGVWSMGAIIPYMSLPDEMKMTRIHFFLTRPLLRSEYDAISEDFRKLYSEQEAEISDFYGIDIDEKSTMRTMMLASVFMSLISAFSACIIYRYMLTKRIKMTAVYRICGCTEGRSAWIYVGEMFSILLASCVTGSVLFELILEPRLEKNYEWFTVIYKDNSCYLLILLYFMIVAASVAAMIFVSCRKTPKEMINSKIK